MRKPVCIVYDLYCGLGGFSEGFLAEGYECIGYDIEAHDYGTGGYPGTLILRDVLSIHGSEFKDAAVIVASPPCQKYSYMAMPWKRAKAQAKAIREDLTGKKLEALNELFNECFRLQREASEAAGHHIPLIIENVRGAQPWVGPAKWNYGSFYLWGDVPALMPMTFKAIKVASEEGRRTDVGNGARFTPRDCGIEGRSVQSAAVEEMGIKQAGISGMRENGKGGAWFQDGAAQHGSKSPKRKMASAMIAKIPFPLAQHIARTFKPR